MVISMSVVAIIQARTSSTRLPEKVLKPLPYGSDITVLQQVIRRVKKSKSIEDIIIATTTEAEDDKIVEIAKKENVKFFRGSKEDVLSRYYYAAKENKADVVVRITSDCPCIDWNIIDRCVDRHLQLKSDYTSNCIERTFPHGLDVEVISFNALEEAFLKADKKYEREHVCPYIHTTHKDKFILTNVIAEKDERGEDIRVTVDTIEDYTLLCAAFDYLFYENKFFDVKDIVRLFEKKPWLKNINEKVLQKKIFQSLDEEIEEAIKILKLQELNMSAAVLKKYMENEK